MRNPTGLCMCGCGQATPRATVSRRGYQRGEPLCYLRGHSTRATGPAYEVDPFGCWNWLRHKHHEGYGRAWDGMRVRGAHVLAWESFHGSHCPAGHDIHHLCGNPSCVNPYHLEAMSRREHMAYEGRRPYGNPRAEIAS